jgi:hypothetical protein
MSGGASQFDASASALGYLYQCRYALLLALERAEEPNVSISIEKLDDVSFHLDGTPQPVACKSSSRTMPTSAIAGFRRPSWKNGVAVTNSSPMAGSREHHREADPTTNPFLPACSALIWQGEPFGKRVAVWGRTDKAKALREKDTHEDNLEAGIDQ